MLIRRNLKRSKEEFELVQDQLAKEELKNANEKFAMELENETKAIRYEAIGGSLLRR